MKKVELENLLKKGAITLKEYEDGIDILNGKKKGTITLKEDGTNDEIESELSYEEKHLKLLESILDNSQKTKEYTRFIVNYIIIMLMLAGVYIIYTLFMFMKYNNGY